MDAQIIGKGCRLEDALTSLLAPNGQMKLPGGVVDEAQDQHGAQDEQQLVCGLHGRQSFTWHHPGHYLQHQRRTGFRKQSRQEQRHTHTDDWHNEKSRFRKEEYFRVRKDA